MRPILSTWVVMMMTATNGPGHPVRTAAGEAPAVEISVKMEEPWTHYFDVEMTVREVERDSLEFVMPVWTPGSYLVREFSRNVQDFAAADELGKSLEWEKTEKNRWRVRSRGAGTVRVHYRVYAFEVSVRTSFLDDSHGYISGAGVFMFVEGRLKNPYRVTIHPYPGWERISTGLDPLPGDPRTFSAPDYDILVDSPIEIGNQVVLDFEVRGVAHHISIYGEGNYQEDRLRTDVAKIVETASAVFGDLPYRHYTFLVQLLNEGGGGLEHLNSTSLQAARWTFKPEESYRRFLGLVSHEYFHLWNVKRLRPLELGPFDYTRENYTRLLWFSEGFTDYYGDLLLRRAGLCTADQYLEELSKLIRGHMETPGRRVQSAAEASFDAWVKLYRRDENFVNSGISYYTKGALVALVMDLELRKRSNGTRSLDDLMRKMYEDFAKGANRGFVERELRDAAETIAGGPVEEIFDAYVSGTEEIDFAKYLGYAGLRFSDPKEESGAKGSLGITTRTQEGILTITEVKDGSPAHKHGLNVRDEILAIDGFRVTQESLNARVREETPGSRIEVTVARAGKLRTFDVTVGEKEPDRFRISRMDDPSESQLRVYESWMAAEWEEKKKTPN